MEAPCSCGRRATAKVVRSGKKLVIKSGVQMCHTCARKIVKMANK